MIVAIDTLKAHKRNYNKHPEHQVKRLTVSLRKFGQRKPITTWRNTVLTGHGVFLAAKQLGWTEIDIAPCPDEWTEEMALAWLAADNELARLADPDLAQLAEIIEEARNHDAELLEAIGFNEAEFAALLDSIAPPMDDPDTTPQMSGLEFRIVIICDGEMQQVELLERFEAEGLNCQALIS